MLCHQMLIVMIGCCSIDLASDSLLCFYLCGLECRIAGLENILALILVLQVLNILPVYY